MLSRRIRSLTTLQTNRCSRSWKATRSITSPDIATTTNSPNIFKKQTLERWLRASGVSECSPLYRVVFIYIRLQTNLMEDQPTNHPQDETEQPDNADSTNMRGRLSSRDIDLDFSKFTSITRAEFEEHADQRALDKEEPSSSAIQLHIVDSVEKGTGLQKYVAYLIKGEDEKGQFEALRRYSEFDALRTHMIERWPGCYVPPIPSKQLIGKAEMQVTLNRTRFLNEFLKEVAALPHLYYGQEFQTFIRSPESTELIKVLEKMKRDNYDVLLRKYQEAFPDCTEGKDQIAENINRANLFEIFVKDSLPIVIQHKKQARTLAEARQRYDEKIGIVFDRILPVYEEGSIIEFTEGDQSRCIYARIHQYEELAAKKNRFQQATKQNPYWLIYDVLKFQQRQMEAIQDCFGGVKRITAKIEDITKDIASNTEQIENLQAGKTTFKSIITKGTNEQIIIKLKAQNEELQKLKATVEELQSIVFEYVNKQVINNFKTTRKHFFTKALKRTFAYEMFYVQSGCNFYEDLKQISQDKIDTVGLPKPEAEEKAFIVGPSPPNQSPQS